MFACVWLPEPNLQGYTALLVLSVCLPWRDRSLRWKEVVEPTPGRFTPHIELYEVAEIDGEVSIWVQCGWEAVPHAA